MPQELRAGIGFDIHRLVRGRRLVLGGVEIPAESGLLGHSDGDALLHAVCDALLGACGLGDIGDLFPDTDARFKGRDSAFFVHEVLARTSKAGWKVANIDTIVFLERPRLGPWKRAMRDRIAALLGLAAANVGVKAKTMEKLGPIGGRRAVAALAQVLLVRTK
ncbi:MAG: 2-C-methyl-D-erythritol 2,4-cyclodiphosphate synthase [Planctomycetota bacterium]|nr:2-C-methyl-D-erythritol 2,4-cyclodiphosphate synthase [Planctomycetota bacterium]